jgi:hypothetical protein
MQTQGKNAGIAGKSAEDNIARFLASSDYKVFDAKGDFAKKLRAQCKPDTGKKTPVDQDALFNYLKATEGPRIVLRNFRNSLPSVFGVAHEKDFIILSDNPLMERVVMEIKSQDVGGSVDEKFPFMKETARVLAPIHSVILVEGNGFSESAVSWMKREIQSLPYATFFTSLADLKTWILKNLR